MLYTNSATLDFGGLSKSNFPELNTPTDVNLFNWSGTACGYRCRSTTYVLGAIRMIHHGGGKVSIVNDAATDYDWNQGGSLKRQAFINTERVLKGLDDSHGFNVFYYGFGTLNQ